MYGKTPADFQTGINVSTDAITGTLKKVTGYTGFSTTVSEQSGHYLALTYTVKPADANVTVEVVGGSKTSVKLADNNNFVCLITNKDTQQIKVTASVDGNEKVKTYSLKGLTLSA